MSARDLAEHVAREQRIEDCRRRMLAAAAAGNPEDTHAWACELAQLVRQRPKDWVRTMEVARGLA